MFEKKAPQLVVSEVVGGVVVCAGIEFPHDDAVGSACAQAGQLQRKLPIQMPVDAHRRLCGRLDARVDAGRPTVGVQAMADPGAKPLRRGRFPARVTANAVDRHHPSDKLRKGSGVAQDDARSTRVADEPDFARRVRLFAHTRSPARPGP